MAEERPEGVHLSEWDRIRLAIGREMTEAEQEEFARHAAGCVECRVEVKETEAFVGDFVEAVKIEDAVQQIVRDAVLNRLVSSVEALLGPGGPSEIANHADDRDGEEFEDDLDEEDERLVSPHRLKKLVAEAGRRADEVVAVAARAPARAVELLDEAKDRAAYGYVLLYTCQGASIVCHQNATNAMKLASEAGDRAREFPVMQYSGLGTPSAEEVRGEAAMLESQAQLALNRPQEALALALYAQDAMKDVGDPVGLARAWYFEASARMFLGEHREAIRILRRALNVFQSYTYEDWEGKCWASLGVLLRRCAKLRWAMRAFNRALGFMEPTENPGAYGTTLAIRADTLAKLGEVDEAAAGYQMARILADRHGLASLSVALLMGLGEVEFLRGHPDRALCQFRFTMLQAQELKLERDVQFASVYIAECQAQLGRTADMMRTIGLLREYVARSSGIAAPGVAEMLSFQDALDRRTDPIPHVRAHLAMLVSEWTTVRAVRS